MKKFFVCIVLSLLLSGKVHAESNFSIVDKNPAEISFKYYHSVFRGQARIERARKEAKEHCEYYNSNVIFKGNEKSSGNWQTILFECVAKREKKEKKLAPYSYKNFEKMKERAKAECLDFGFKADTIKFAECVLELVSDDF